MDGFSDMPFRVITREYGGAMSYTEFAACEGILREAKPVLRQLDFDPIEKPQMSFQIFDASEDRIVEAAKYIEDLHLRDDPRGGIVDLNMGCSVSGVSGRGAGAGLLRDPAKIGRIFNRLSKTLKIPVTGKIRLGWDATTRNYREVAKVLEDNGASLVAVHGRTKEQAYRGVADWSAIAEVKQTVKIPVIGNGDVKCVADIERIKRQTGCDAVMIGRAAIGNPWIFARKDRHEVSLPDVIALLRRHLNVMLSYYGPRGLILFRKHAVRYITGVHGAASLRHALVTAETPEHFLELVANAEQALVGG
jgi:nifR3 family TIM-barrel protein